MKAWILVLVLFLYSCDKNILSSSSSLDSDDDKYSLAMKYQNSQDYDNTIATIKSMSPNAQTATKVQELLATGYAGKCGLNFVDYINKISAISSGTALKIMMSPFVQIKVDPVSCKLALATMEQIGPTESRLLNENIFTSITGMVLLGTSLRSYADQSPTLGDGTADRNICSAITDSEIDDMIIGFGFFSKNFSYVSNSIVGSYSKNVMTDIMTTCQNVAGSSCEITDPTLITPLMRTAFRDITNTVEFGIGPFVTGGNQQLIPSACP